MSRVAILAIAVLETSGRDTILSEDKARIAFRVGKSLDAGGTSAEADDVPTQTVLAEFPHGLNPVCALLDLLAYMDIACAVFSPRRQIAKAKFQEPPSVGGERTEVSGFHAPSVQLRVLLAQERAGLLWACSARPQRLRPRPRAHAQCELLGEIAAISSDTKSSSTSLPTPSTSS